MKVDGGKGKFVTSIHRKPTFSGVYTNFTSFIPINYKFSLIFTLLFRYFIIASDFSKFHVKVSKLKCLLLRNGYPKNLIDFCIKRFLEKIFTAKSINVIPDVPKNKILVILPYLGTASLQARNRLVKLFPKSLTCCDLQVIFKSFSNPKRACVFKKDKPILNRNITSAPRSGSRLFLSLGKNSLSLVTLV